MGFQAGQLGQRGPHLVEPGPQDAHHVSAWGVASVGGGQHLTHLAQRQAGRLRAPDKFQPVDELRAVVAVAGLGACRGGQQTFLLVEPDRLGRRCAAAGEFTDLHHTSLDIPPYWNVYGRATGTRSRTRIYGSREEAMGTTLDGGTDRDPGSQPAELRIVPLTLSSFPSRIER